MKPAYADDWTRLFIGNANEVLDGVPERSVHTCITSPPYFGLRSYLPADHPDKAKEGGTQETPEAYVEWLVEVFRGVWRVLRDDGTVWLNLGDSYNSAANFNHDRSGLGKAERYAEPASGGRRLLPGYKPKDLIGIPWAAAFALRADGWYLRADVIWAKGSCMPESMKDRPTRSHEHLFLLSKRPSYFYDAEAIKEPNTEGSLARHGKGFERPFEHSRMAGVHGHRKHEGTLNQNGLHISGRNKRDVWHINPKPYKGAHYATFPPALVEPCIKAVASEYGCCSACLSPYRRVVEHRPATAARVGGPKTNGDSPRSDGTGPGGYYDAESRTVGWEPTCSHHDADVVPAVVLDPFMGSGTTAWAARRLGRRSIGVDLDSRNVALVRGRLGPQGVLL